MSLGLRISYPLTVGSKAQAFSPESLPVSLLYGSSRIAMSYGYSLYNLLREWQTVFQSG